MDRILVTFRRSKVSFDILFRLLCSLMLGVTNKQLYYAIVQWVEENQ